MISKCRDGVSIRHSVSVAQTMLHQYVFRFSLLYKVSTSVTSKTTCRQNLHVVQRGVLRLSQGNANKTFQDAPGAGDLGDVLRAARSTPPPPYGSSYFASWLLDAGGGVAEPLKGDAYARGVLVSGCTTSIESRCPRGMNGVLACASASSCGNVLQLESVPKPEPDPGSLAWRAFRRA